MYVASQHIQDFLEAFFHVSPIQNEVLSGRKRIHNLCEDGIEKSALLDHRLSSLGTPCDANR